MSGGWLESTGCGCRPASDGDCVAVLAWSRVCLSAEFVCLSTTLHQHFCPLGTSRLTHIRGDLWAQDGQVLLMLLQLHRAVWCASHQCSLFVLGLSEGSSGWKAGEQVHSYCYLERDSAALPLCSKWQSKRAVNDVAPLSAKKWKYLKMHCDNKDEWAFCNL